MSGVISKVHLGVPVVEADCRLVIFAEAHADLTAYAPYAVRPSRNTDTDVVTAAAMNDGKAVTAAVATLAVPHWVGVPQEAVSSGDIAKLVVGGACKMLVNNDGGAITGGSNFLEATNGNAFGQADGTAQTVNGLAYACEDQDNATASAINVQMLAVPVQVQA